MACTDKYKLVYVQKFYVDHIYTEWIRNANNDIGFFVKL